MAEASDRLCGAHPSLEAPRPRRQRRPVDLVGLCAVHHLRAIHEGLLRVTGVAPDQLRWVLADGEIFRGGATTAGP